MALSTQDGVLGGAQWPRFLAKAITPTMVIGKPQSLWSLAGTPGAGTFDTTLAGVALTSNAGQIPWTNPGAGNSYLARFQGLSSLAGGTLLLVDRLWHNGGFTITTTTGQTVTSAAFPARDVDASINGKGVMIGLEVSAACGAAAPAPTLTYTNEAGTGSRTAGLWFPTANSPVIGSFFPFALQAGDLGVKSIQTLALNTSWVSGTVNLVAYRVIAALDLVAGFPNSIDALSSGFPRIFDNSVLQLIFIPGVTTATVITGSVVWSQG